MAEGYATPEHRVLPSYFGAAGVPDFQQSTDKEIAKWWDKRLGAPTSVGKKLLANGDSNWMAMDDITEDELIGEPYGVAKKEARVFVKIIDKVREAYLKDETARDAAHRHAVDVGAGGTVGGPALGSGTLQGGAAGHTPYPTMVHAGKGLWQEWAEARVVIATLQGWLELNSMDEAGSAVDALMADITGAKVSDVQVLTGVTQRHVKLVYGAMLSLMTVGQKLKVPADLQASRNGLGLVSYYGRECHGDDSASAAIDQFNWENPDACKTAEQVSLWLVEWQNLYKKIHGRGTDYMKNDSDMRRALAALTTVVRGVPGVDGVTLLEAVTDAQKRLDLPAGTAKVDVEEIVAIIKARAARFHGVQKVARRQSEQAAKAAPGGKPTPVAKAKVDGAKGKKGKGGKGGGAKVNAAKAGRGGSVIEAQCYGWLHDGSCTNDRHASMSEGKHAETHAEAFKGVGIPESMKKPCHRFKDGRCDNDAKDCRYSHAAAMASVADAGDYSGATVVCSEVIHAGTDMEEASGNSDDGDEGETTTVARIQFRMPQVTRNPKPRKSAKQMEKVVSASPSGEGKGASKSHESLEHERTVGIRIGDAKGAGDRCWRSADDRKVADDRPADDRPFADDRSVEMEKLADDLVIDTMADELVALVDAGANRGLCPQTKRNRLKRLRKMKKAVPITGFGGDVTATAEEVGDWETKLGNIKRMLVTGGVDQAIVAVKQLCELGYTYVQSTEGACLMHPTKGELWLVEKDGLYYLTRSAVETVGKQEEPTMAQHKVAERVRLRTGEQGKSTVRDASTITDTERELKRRLKEMQDHRRQGHSEALSWCTGCSQARMTGKAAVQQEGDTVPAGAEKGWVISADLFGPLEPDLEGNIWGMVLIEYTTRYGYLECLETKEAKGTLRGLKNFMADLQSKSGDGKVRVVTRVHTDQGTEFDGEFEDWCVDNQVRRTDTGGHRSKGNSVAERRVRMLRDCFKANLVTATGGHDYFHALWGVGSKFADRCINRSNWSNGKQPYEELSGAAYVWEGHDHIFGERCLYSRGL